MNKFIHGIRALAVFDESVLSPSILRVSSFSTQHTGLPTHLNGLKQVFHISTGFGAYIPTAFMISGNPEHLSFHFISYAHFSFLWEILHPSLDRGKRTKERQLS